MKKLTALGMSLFLCIGIVAQDNQPVRFKSAATPEEQAQGSKSFSVKDTEGIDLSAGVVKTPFAKSGARHFLPADNAGSNKTITKGAVSTENLYAAVTYPTAMVGFRKINVEDGSLSPVASYTKTTYKPQAMGVVNGKIYSLDWTINTLNKVTGAWVTVTDMETGEVESSISIFNNFNETPQGGCFVPEEYAYYGYSTNGWSMMDAVTGDCQLLAPEDGQQLFTRNLTYNPLDGCIYGIIGSGKSLVKVSKSNGASTVLKDTEADLYTGYTGGFCFDADSNSFLFNKVNNAAKVSTLMAISATTYNVTEVCQFSTFCQTNAMFCNETSLSDVEAPVAPEFISASFPNGAWFGQVTFKLPSNYNDDELTPLSGKLDYKVTVNGNIVASGTGLAGSEVTCNIKLNESGDLPFAFTAAINGHVSKPAKETIYIGNDTPLAPTNVKLTVQTVTWNPVTKGVHDGFLQLDNLTYTVKINGQLVADGLTGTSCPTNLPLSVEINNYVAEVYAVCNGMTSAPGSSNSLLFGQAYSVPVTLVPTAEEAEIFQVVDNNADKKTWKYFAKAEAFRYTYSSKNDADDYLILPPVKIEDYQYLYEFSLDSYASGIYEEKFEVYAGPTDDVTTMTKIMDEVVVKWTSTNIKRVSTIFKAPEGGKMYIAIRATSEKDNLNLLVKNFEIKKSIVAESGPAAVSDLVCTAAPNGALEATVNFKMPTLTYAGEPLTENVSVVVENMADYKTITGAPGSAQSVTLKCVQSTIESIDPIIITPYAGDNAGMPTNVPLWVGVDLPASPRNLFITPNDTNFGGTLTWTKVGDVGENGGYVKPEDVEYSICQYKEVVAGSGYYGWVIIQNLGKNVDKFQFTIADGAELNLIRLGVIASNVAGQNDTFYPTMAALGKPYPMPAEETFPNGTLTYNNLTYTTDDLTLENPATINEEYASEEHPYALIATQETEGEGFIELPPFSTKGFNKVAFIPNMYIGSCENIRVEASSNGVAYTEIFNLSTLVNVSLSGYQDMILDLPAEFQNKNWVKFRIYGEFTPEKPYLILSGYKLRNLVPYDLAATAIAAPKRVTTGKEYNVTVTATNYGLQDISNYTVELYQDGELVQTKEGGNIAVDGSAETEFTLTMSPIATEAVNLYAKVICPNDATDINNQSVEFTVTPKASTLPAATELQANNNSEGNAVTLTWLEPDLNNLVGEPVTEDFEDADAFAAEYGEWIFADRDEKPVGGFQGLDIPGITAGETTGSFWIWDQSQLGNTSFKAHSGDKYLFSLFDWNGTEVDDWAISPELAGCAQTISFWAKSYSGGPAKIRILYSTGSVDPNDFVEIDVPNTTTIPGTWTEYNVDVPEGAKRFAINSYCNQPSVLMIDDVTYIPVSEAEDANLLGYDIYRDGVKINSALVEENDFTDTNVVKKQTYNYVVVAVFDKGTAKPSNTATITVDESGIFDVSASKRIDGGKGVIRICGFDSEMVVITTADGKVIAKGIAADLNTVNVPAGVYVVRAGKDTAKVIVR